MDVFRLAANGDDYRWLTAVNETDFIRLGQVHDGLGDLVGAPVSVKWVSDENGDKPTSDFPTFGAIPVFSQRAVDALGELLVQHGELLPLQIEGEQLYAYSVTRELAALDEEKSDLLRFPSGWIMDVEEYVFFPERIDKYPIFKLPNLRAEVFVTDSFVSHVRQSRLTGFAFERVWSSG
jgi:hypothetical protein